MKLIVTVSLTFIALFFALNTASAGETRFQSVAQTEYPLGNANLYEFHSEKAERDFRILLSLPAGYESADPDTRYPVIYVVDGQWHFSIAGSVAGGLYYDRGWHESIVVGITWKGTVDDANRLRFQDLTPTVVEGHPDAGRADKYLDFLQYELIPYMDKHYRTSEDRILMGSSLGGLLSLYCLFTRPALFSDHVATTPATWWDNGLVFEKQKAFDPAALTRPMRLYMARGGAELGQRGADAMAEALEAANYSNLEFRFNVIEGAGHGGLNPEAFTRGLQFIFGKKRIDIAIDVLNAYAGVYGGEDEKPEIRLWVEDGRLFGAGGEDPVEVQLVAVAENRFFVPNMGVELWFIYSKEQSAWQVNFKTEGGDILLERKK